MESKTDVSNGKLDGDSGTVNDLGIDPIVEDGEYFFWDVIFLVENILFKVPRHHFEQDSAIFRAMFSLPAAESSEPSSEGTTKERPIRLEGISKADFLAFLKVICPKHFQRREDLSVENWTSVLKLSTMWEFSDARTLAISTLTSEHVVMDPIERIVQTRAYMVDQWYWPSLIQLAVNPQPLSNDDVDRLGMNFSLRVAELRGRIEGYKRGSNSKKSAHTLARLVEFIADLFPEVSTIPFAKCSTALDQMCRSFVPSATRQSSCTAAADPLLFF